MLNADNAETIGSSTSALGDTWDWGQGGQAATRSNKSLESLESLDCGTGGGARTPTPLREPDFESSASANSATPAPRRRYLNPSPSIIASTVSQLGR